MIPFMKLNTFLLRSWTNLQSKISGSSYRGLEEFGDRGGLVTCWLAFALRGESTYAWWWWWWWYDGWWCVGGASGWKKLVFEGCLGKGGVGSQSWLWLIPGGGWLLSSHSPAPPVLTVTEDDAPAPPPSTSYRQGDNTQLQLSQYNNHVQVQKWYQLQIHIKYLQTKGSKNTVN